jgi:3-oxoacyl-[acyl-carrier-protein] synthase I
VLKDLEHAKARGARIYGEVTDYGATSDGYDMAAPSGLGGERAMRLAMSTLPEGRRLDYINSHGTSTQVGDVTEIEAIQRVFSRGATPPISSTKSLTGHSLGATGVQEAIYPLIMINHGFIAASANIETLDPALDAGEIVTSAREGIEIDGVLSNSFGFGGTNATLALGRFVG